MGGAIEMATNSRPCEASYAIRMAAKGETTVCESPFGMGIDLTVLGWDEFRTVDVGMISAR